MNCCLVGYTGFVGSNLACEKDIMYRINSKNIADSFGLNPDLLIYAGVSARKYIANQFPKEDKAIILNAIDNIRRINPKRIVLISTIKQPAIWFN